LIWEKAQRQKKKERRSAPQINSGQETNSLLGPLYQ
jgi:hypothetical protein